MRIASSIHMYRFIEIVASSNVLHAKTKGERTSMFDIKDLASIGLSRNIMNLENLMKSD